MKRKLLWTAVFVAVLALFCTGCGNPADSNNTPVTNTDVVFSDLTADGSATATTTTLTLTFDKDITGIAAADITIDPKSTGTVKGALTRTGTGTYRLAVTGISASGQIGVTVSKAGYNISPASNNVNVFYYYDPSAIAAAFNNLTANGTENETTTLLTFTFDKDIAGLTAADITIDPKDTGTIKGDLTCTGTGVYQLAVTGIGAAGQINVTVSKAGYTISPPNRTVNVFYYSDPSAIQAAFTNLETDGAEGEATTTTLTLTFNKDITDFAAADITLMPNNTGAVKGDLTRTGTGVYQLAVNGITAAGQITVGVTKDGYNITPASRNANVFYYSDSTDIAVSFTNLEADGSAAATTTFLTLAFDEDISGLSADDITIDPKGTGTTRGYLTQNLTTGEYRLAVSGITASGEITVGVSKDGYSFTPTSRTADVFYYNELPGIGIGLGDSSVKLYLDNDPLTEGGTTDIPTDTGTFTVSVADGNYTEISWYLNGELQTQASMKQSIVLSKRMARTYLVTVEAQTGEEKNSGSHTFVVGE